AGRTCQSKTPCVRLRGLRLYCRTADLKASSSGVSAPCESGEVAMLVGYVSDERYIALVDVAVVIENSDGIIASNSLANGAIVASVEPGPCRVTLAKDGFGAKRVEMTATPGKPYQFRLLSDRLLGYVWPKWVTAGQEGEFRIHSTDSYK